MANKILRTENDQFLHSDLVAFSGNTGFGYDEVITSEIPSSSIPLTITVEGTDAISIPAGTDLQRPTPFGIPKKPMLRFNVLSQTLEVYYPTGSEWRNIGTGLDNIEGDLEVQGDISTNAIEYTIQSSTPITSTSDNFWTFHGYYGLGSSAARGYSHHTVNDPSVPGGSTTYPNCRVCGYLTTDYSGSKHSGAYLLVSHEGQGGSYHNFNLEVTGLDEGAHYDPYNFKLGFRTSGGENIIYGNPTLPTTSDMLLKLTLSSALSGVLKGDIIDVWDDASDINTSPTPRWTHRFISDADTNGSEFTVDSWYAVERDQQTSVVFFNPIWGQKIRHIRPGVGEITHTPEVSGMSCNGAGGTALVHMTYKSSTGIWCNMYNYRRAFYFQYFGYGDQVTPTPIISGGPVL